VKASSCNHGNAADAILSDKKQGPTQDVYVHMALVIEEPTHQPLWRVVWTLYV
jgi:hypothetical protein